MRPRRRSNPSTCHLRSACNGRSFPFSQSSRFPRRLAATFAPTPFIRTVDDGSFHPARHFIWETGRRRRWWIRLGRTSWPSIFIKTLDFAKVLSLPRSSTFFVLSQKSRWIYSYGSSSKETCLMLHLIIRSDILNKTTINKMYHVF